MSNQTVNLRQLGKRIKRLRLDRGLSQEDVAQPAFTAAYLSHVEHGKRRPSHAALSHIAERLGVSLELLLSGRDPNEDLRLEIEIQSAIAALHAGDVSGARGRLETARTEAEKAGHPRAVLRASEGLAQALYRTGDYDEALGIFQRAIESATDSSAEDLTTARVGLARCLFQLGKLPEALHLLESHELELLKADSADPTALLQTYAALIPPYFRAGLLDKATKVAERGWELAPQVPELDQRACLHVNRAALLLTQGHVREALASLSLAEDLFRQLGWHGEQVKVALARSHALVDNGDLRQAESLVQDVLERSGDAVTRSDKSQALVHLAQVRRRLQNPGAALEAAKEAAQLAKNELPTIEAEALREAGLCSYELDEPDRALSYWRRALKGFQAVGSKQEIAKTARLIGDHLLDAGDEKKAAAAYREGLAAMGELR